MPKSRVIAGFIDDPEQFLEVGSRAREHGFKGLDGFMPYPVHGFESALGLKKSRVPAAAKLMLVIGAGLGLLFAGWTSAIDWPINVGGKPLFSWQAFIPVVFECGVLLAGITTFILLFHLGRYYPAKDPKMLRERLTDNQFALLIPIKDNGNREDIKEFLRKNGIDDVDEFEI
jgi:hypothetical protein